MGNFQRFRRSGETGYALISTLICLLVGSLIIAATLGYANTTLHSKVYLGGQVKGTYAAEAGIEDVFSCISHSISPRTALPQVLNGNNVSMQTQNLGQRSFYAGEWVTGGTHSDWLLIDGEAVWDNITSAYKYTITVTWNAPSSTTIHLLEVGVQLPAGYTYEDDSAALFESNLSQSEPDDNVDNVTGSHMLKWVFPSPRPSVTQSDPTRTQVFYITGEGEPDGHYSWIVAAREDIGHVSELTGTFYTITATATSQEDNTTSARIEVDIILSLGDIYILSWQIYSN